MTPRLGWLASRFRKKAKTNKKFWFQAFNSSLNPLSLRKI
jgi:hypothetical protein